MENFMDMAVFMIKIGHCCMKEIGTMVNVMGMVNTKMIEAFIKVNLRMERNVEMANTPCLMEKSMKVSL